MARTEREICTAPHSGEQGQAMRAINGQYMRSLWKSGLLILILTGLFVAYLLIKPGGPERVTFVDNIIQGLLEGVGLLLALPLFVRGIGRIRQSPPSFAERVAPAKTSQRWVPLLLGLGILSYIIGQVLWTYNENILQLDRKSTRLNSSHRCISYAVFCLKKKKNQKSNNRTLQRQQG